MSVTSIKNEMARAVRESDDGGTTCLVITKVSDAAAQRIADAVGTYAEPAEKKQIEAFMKSASFSDTGRAALQNALARPAMPAKMRRQLLDAAKKQRDTDNRNIEAAMVGSGVFTIIGVIAAVAVKPSQDKDVVNDID